MALSSLALSSLANAQTVVDYTSTGWTDFGTGSSQSAVSGNFYLGWTAADSGAVRPSFSSGALFGANHQTLSGTTGISGDTALWFTATPSSTELATLSLSGFTSGSTYTLGFSASHFRHIQPGTTWNAATANITADIMGADITSWTSTQLSDPVDSDGLNDWVSQQITFTANASTVSFEFGGTTTGISPNHVARVGIDGFSASLAPEPSSTALLGLGTLGLLMRRRR